MVSLSADVLLDAIALRFAGDQAFLAFKSLTPGSTNNDKADFIKKDEEPEGNVTDKTVPICLIYTRPGIRDHRSTQFYNSKLAIDCFAKDANTARAMIKRALELIHGWRPSGLASTACALAYETSFKTGIPGVKGHRAFFDCNYYVG